MSHLPADAGGMETRAINANLEADASRKKRSGAITPGETVTGWVAEVTDGDGLLVNVAGRGRFTVRLAYVDAPEFDQPGGKEAKDALRKLAFQGRRGVGLRAVRDDRYGRTVAVVWSAGRTLNEELVRSGHAWVDPRFVSGAARRRYKALENEARRARRGLWNADGGPVAPWDWRQNESSQAAPIRSLEEADRRFRRRSSPLGWIAAIVVFLAIVGKCATDVKIGTEKGRSGSGTSAPHVAGDRAPAGSGQGDAPDRRVSRQVRDIQRMLKGLGYQPGPIDGIPGPRTREAIRAFETESGLQPTGEATDGTTARLREEFERQQVWYEGF